MLIKQNKIIVFDFDGTLFKKNTFVCLVFHLFKKFGICVKLYIILIIFLRKMRLLSQLDFHNKILYILKGSDCLQMDKIFRDLSNKIRNKFNLKILKLLENYTEKGYTVIILTGAIDRIVNKLTGDLNVEIFATKLSYDKEGKFLGKIDSKLVLGSLKKKILEQKYPHNQIIFYSDSMVDKPVFRFAYKSYLVDSKTQKIKYFKNEKNIIK